MAASSSASTVRQELKIDDEGGFIRFFRSLPTTEDNGTVRVFDRGDFYTAHGENAVFIARTIYKTTSVLKQLGRSDSSGLPSVMMTPAVYRNLLHEMLLRQGKRVEIWESSGRMNWKLVKQASPGNLQDVEEELGGQITTAPVMMAVKVVARAAEARSVGVCFANASVRELGVSEFADNDVYSNFEALLIQLGVQECLLPADSARKDAELAKLRKILDSCGVAYTERGAGDFGTRDIEQDLARLLRDDNNNNNDNGAADGADGAGGAGVVGATGMGMGVGVGVGMGVGARTLPQTDLRLAMGAAAALIRYLGLLSDAANFGQFRLYQHDLAQYMRLDAAALKALNLMPGAGAGGGGTSGGARSSTSLYGLLNHCRTPVGSRLLAQWLKQPLMSVEAIERRQQLVEAFVVDTALRQTMQEEHLKAVPDLYRLAKRFQRKMASLEDVVRAYQVVIRLPGFIATLEGVMDEVYRDPLDAEYTSKLRDYSDSLAKLQEMVETTVDLDALEQHEFIIKPEFDESLRTIRKRLDRLKYDMSVEHRKAGQDLGQDTDKKLFLENHRVHGWCFRLTRNEAACIRNKKEYQECSTQKNGVYFTTSALQTMRREFDQLSESYNRTQTALVGEVVNVAASYCPVLEKLAAMLAHLDVIVSFAHVSVHAPTPYVRPRMHARGAPDGAIILRAARHPCLEQQDGVAFIANDVELRRSSGPDPSPSADADASNADPDPAAAGSGSGGPELLIVTGPNMGGKSTYIRQVGCIALLAQTGCFVPCAHAELSPVDCILARVGAGDAQLKGVSTFMAEMLETAHILRSATRQSLLIIDELGRGTSTYDGFGLAWAIAEHIVARIGCFALFATHFHELTALADKYPRAVRNLHVVAHIEDGGSSGGGGGGGGVGVGGGSGGGNNNRQRREVTLLYKVEPGVSDQSFGIHVAELVRFPEKVVNMARRKADELEDFSSVSTAASATSATSTTTATSATSATTTTGNAAAATAADSEEIQQGATLLRDLLKRWTTAVNGDGSGSRGNNGPADRDGGGNGGGSAMARADKIRLLKEMAMADEALLANPFFKSLTEL